MSYGSGNQMIVDWVRVRNWCGAGAVASVGSEEAAPPGSPYCDRQERRYADRQRLNG